MQMFDSKEAMYSSLFVYYYYLMFDLTFILYFILPSFDNYETSPTPYGSATN